MTLMDTDICVELLRGNEKVINARNNDPDQISISFFSIAELYYGAEKSSNPFKNNSLIEEFLFTVNIINPEIPILKKFGETKAYLSKNGIMLSDADIFIASTALVNCDKLVTGNINHYSRIPNLAIENWTR